VSARGGWRALARGYVPAVLAFAPDPDPPPPRDGARKWRGWLLLAAAVTAVATAPPWVEVSFARLFGVLAGPPGWQTSAGFTCLCTCLLVAVMTLAETQAPATHHAVRPASLLLVAVCTAALALEWADGPGMLRGVSATWTGAFWLVLGAVPVLLAICFVRWTAAARSTGGYSSSGPPT
jgi:hypothetical protein